MTAIVALADEEYEAALARARTDEGPGFEAFRRVCGELTERLEILMWWMHPDVASAVADGDAGDTDDSRSAGAAADDQPSDDAPDPRLAAIVARGHADGSIDPAVQVEWVEQLLWAALHASVHAPAMTSMTGFEARSQALRSLLKAVAADPDAV